MLQLKNICKNYKTGDLVQKALDDVTLNFRDNEFVSILGPSGSGKSTLLNIIGGLDQYDSGELLIDGVSTVKYKNEDWDSYRNHTIGFVFQSYNLISHQSVLSNVELALTISGISKSERKKLALEALEKVGLKEHAHKRPNQLSGGQMQRVAIARALVNNPKIVLADEPTGALDSETSVQVLDLLKEVAKDRLVIMVTHNPDLAQKYSTRIVKLYDGKIISDSDKYVVRRKTFGIHKNFGKASMNFATSIGLSFNNLKNKRRRTIMVAFAGSIGIIGIALILGLSNGVNKFINDTEEETMISYPIQINTSSFSLTTTMNTDFYKASENSGEISELKTLENMLSLVNQNDLSSLKNYFETDGIKVFDYSVSVEYKYNITPIIYTDYENKYIKVNPNEAFSSLGLSADNILFSNYSINAFDKLPSNERLYKEKYHLMYGNWPTNKNEALLITNPGGGVSDFIFYSMGLRDNKDLEQMVKDFGNNKKSSVVEDERVWNSDDIIGREFKVLSSSILYKYDSKNKVYIDASNDTEFVEKILDNNSTSFKIVGIAEPNEDNKAPNLREGIWYTDELIESLREIAGESDVVQAQKETPDTNVLTNGPFGEKKTNDIDFTKLFTIDQNKIGSAFKIDQSKFKIDTSSIKNMDFQKYLKNMNLNDVDIEYLQNLDIKVDEEKFNKLINDVANDYLEYASHDPTTDYLHISDAFSEFLESAEGRKIINDFLEDKIEESAEEVISSEDIRGIITRVMSGYSDWAIENNYTDPTRFNEYLSEYLSSNVARNLINQEISRLTTKIINNISLNQSEIIELASLLEEGYIKYAKQHNKPDPTKLKDSFLSYLKLSSTKKLISDGLYDCVDVEDLKAQIKKHEKESSKSVSKQFEKILKNATNDLADNIKDIIIKAMNSLPKAMSVDSKKFGAAFKMNLSEEQIKSFINAMINNSESSYDNNMKYFGYAADEDVYEIDIYPKNFESKQLVMELMDDYNEKMTRLEEYDKTITYTDLIGTMLSSVTTIVNVISYVLIAFVAISLVVSSIMIGVITYISVLERKKEIGVLRAIGASKRNISQVFNAETGIIGTFAGVLGIVISELLFIPANIILRNETGIPTLTAYLKLTEIIALVLISILLTLIGGLIPSKSAANQNPVEALRTD